MGKYLRWWTQEQIQNDELFDVTLLLLLCKNNVSLGFAIFEFSHEVDVEEVIFGFTSPSDWNGQLLSVKRASPKERSYVRRIVT
jgi:hypothetical protein